MISRNHVTCQRSFIYIATVCPLLLQWHNDIWPEKNKLHHPLLI